MAYITRYQCKCDRCGVLHERRNEPPPVHPNQEKLNAETDGWLCAKNVFVLCVSCSCALAGALGAKEQREVVMWLDRWLLRFNDQIKRQERSAESGGKRQAASRA